MSLSINNISVLGNIAIDGKIRILGYTARRFGVALSCLYSFASLFDSFEAVKVPVPNTDWHRDFLYETGSFDFK